MMARFTIRGILCALILLSGITWASTDEAAYVDGTVTAIPYNTMGTLDLSGAEALHFRYGGTSYDLPYEQITRFHLGQDNEGFGSQIAGGAAKIGKTVLPMLFSKTKRLTIDFRSADDTNTQTLVFELPGHDAKAALPVLQAHTADPRQQPTEAQAAYREPTRGLYTAGEWWGNVAWRTERNKQHWPARSEEQAIAPQPDQQPVEVAASQDE